MAGLQAPVSEAMGVVNTVGKPAMRPARITAAEARLKTVTGAALLVCAYRDNAQYKQGCLDGSISYSEFQALKPGLRMDDEIIFYCGRKHERISTSLAARFMNEGYTNVMVLIKGINGWMESGFFLIE
jgi:rhodanese-related sulfurtransferase